MKESAAIGAKSNLFLQDRVRGAGTALGGLTPYLPTISTTTITTTTG